MPKRRTLQIVVPASTLALVLGFVSSSNGQQFPRSSFNIMGKGSSSALSNNNHVCTSEKSCETNKSLGSQEAADTDLPSLIVFDLDDCLWTPEMHELSDLPSVPVEGPLDPNNPSTSPLGTVGLAVPSRKKRGGWGGYDTEEEVVELYPGARLALREIVLNPKYRNVKIGVASSSLEPSYSRACMAGIEIVEGVTMKDAISYAQIGRSGKLTSRKTSHFRLIHEESGVPYEEMLFFDDCNWGDHVGDLNRAFGVVGVRTPNGLKLEEFHEGLRKFSEVKMMRDGGV